MFLAMEILMFNGEITCKPERFLPPAMSWAAAPHQRPQVSSHQAIRARKIHDNQIQKYVDIRVNQLMIRVIAVAAVDENKLV